MDIGNPSSLQLTGSATFEGWVKENVAAPNAAGAIVTKRDAEVNNAGWYLGQGGTSSYFVMVTKSGVTTERDGTTIPLVGQWYHVAGVYNASAQTLDIYVNGVLDNGSISGTVPSSQDDNGKNVNIGRKPNNNSYENGTIDDVRIYNYARTPAQIAWDYNRGKPLAHWKFDECQGTTANDSSGNAYHATIVPLTSGNTAAGTCNSSTSTEMWNNGTTGKFNASLDFDGTDDFVQASDAANLRFNDATQDFSLFAWVKRETSGVANIIISKFDAANDGWQLRIGNTDIVVCTQDLSIINSSSTITDTNWHLVGCTFDRDGNGQAYIDGKADGTPVSLGSDAMDTTNNIRIGTRAYTSTNYFNGQIDDVRIYNYALNPTQIRTLYNENSSVRFGPAAGSP